MLSFKLKENCIDPNSTQPIEDYLRSLGITKIESFLGIPPKEDELNPMLLDNMDKCITILHEGFENKKKFFIQVDSDVDGYTSASIFYRFFKGCYPEADIVWRLHEGKEHGVIINTTPEDADYIILPDSGSMQLEEQLELVSKGKIVIILDHHSVTKMNYSDNIILVNNQVSENFSNKDLSGAGVVFKVIQAYDNRYPSIFNSADDFYDLAALGIMSDMMNLKNLDNNYIVYQGLQHIKNKMFKALLNQQSYSIKNIEKPSKIDTVFYISPLINGVIRAGTAEEKELLFKGFIEEPTEELITTTYRGEDRTEDYYQYVARVSYNVKNRQNTQKEKCFNYLKEKIEKEKLNENKVIAVITSKEDKVPTPQNITGLIAMELLKEYNKPVLVLRPKLEEDCLTYAGSGRSKPVEGFDSFLSFVRSSKYCIYGEGHNHAFGAALKAENYQNFIDESNERLANIEFSNSYVEVDAVFNNGNINYDMMYDFAAYSDIYGNSIPQPKIALTGILNSNDVKVMGKDSSSVGINIGKVTCVKFKDKKLVEQLSSLSRATYTIIGRVQLNEWMGNYNIQLLIDDIEVEPIKIQSLF